MRSMNIGQASLFEPTIGNVNVMFQEEDGWLEPTASFSGLGLTSEERVEKSKPRWERVRQASLTFREFRDRAAQASSKIRRQAEGHVSSKQMVQTEAVLLENVNKGDLILASNEGGNRNQVARLRMLQGFE